MTPEELDRLERLCAAATPGPWTVDRIGEEDGEIIYDLYSTSPWKFLFGLHDSNDEDGVVARTNAAFIAAARTALPDLIAEVRRLSDLNGKLTSDFNSLLVHESRTEDQRNVARAEVERLREALKTFAREATRYDRDPAFMIDYACGIKVSDLRAAREALAPIPPGQEGEGK